MTDLDRVTLGRVLWRSFFLQAAWNYRGQQNLGYTACVLPALESIHGKDTPEFKAAVVRGLAPFNTQPHISGPIIGALIRAEEIGAAGGFTPEKLDRFRLALTTAFAAIGDAFFWNALIPSLAVIGLFWAVRAEWFGALLFLILFNAVHGAIRVWGFERGYRRGLDVARALDRWRLPILALRLRLLTAGTLGLLAVWSLGPVLAGGPAWRVLIAGAAAGAAVYLGSMLLRRRFPVETFIYGLPAVLAFWFAMTG